MCGAPLLQSPPWCPPLVSFPRQKPQGAGHRVSMAFSGPALPGPDAGISQAPKGAPVGQMSQGKLPWLCFEMPFLWFIGAHSGHWAGERDKHSNSQSDPGQPAVHPFTAGKDFRVWWWGHKCHRWGYLGTQAPRPQFLLLGPQTLLLLLQMCTSLQICCQYFVTPTLTQHLDVDSDHTSQGQILRTLGEGTPEKGQLCEHL